MRRRKKSRKSISKKKSLYGIVFGIIILSITFIYFSQYSPSNQTISQTFQLKAAIVDQGSLSPAAGPNTVFIETATNTLKQAGYTVDYYPGEKVTVEFYRNLPTHGYKIIVLRVHSATGGYPTVALFTSELYSTSKYVYEQLTGKLDSVRFYYEDIDRFFGIPPSFIESSMKGKFNNTIIIMMGCEGLKNPSMAEAFIEKGAKTYISWNGSVSASHTDQATTHLLQHLITEKQTIKQAVDNTMKEVGADPSSNSILSYYPNDAENYTIQNIVGTQVIVSTIIEIKHKEFSETK